MLITPVGKFNGDAWEELCQICFKLKYEKVNYQPVPASPGDFGLDGFTGDGDCFQCYCPDDNYPPDTLYEKQRDKITADLKKLITYETEIAKLLNGKKFKRWIFVTPLFNRNKLLLHCADKADEYKKKGLGILDADFSVLIHDIDFLAEYLPIALNSTKRKLEITPFELIDDTALAKYRGDKIDLINTAETKNRSRFPASLTDIDTRLKKLTDLTIKSFLMGEDILRTWQIQSPMQYEHFMHIVDQYENEVQALCLIPTSNNNERYNLISRDLRERLINGFPDLSDVTIRYLTERVLADWILRCPINFD